MRNGGPDWTRLQAEYGRKLANALESRIGRGENFEITAEQLRDESGAALKDAEGLLDAVERAGAIHKDLRFFCGCAHRLSPDEVNSGVCPYCNKAFADFGPDVPVGKTVFVHEGIATRDTRWVLALHGMNTQGAWQEEFAWLVSRTYGYSVPVAIYKYGVVRPGAFLRFRQRALTRQLIGRIKRLSKETDQYGFGGRPDVIAHSFGTWLLGHALQHDRSLKVGRVILTGCILRPDFDWKQLMEERGDDGKQVEAVLCHYGTKDFWAAIAHYLIPDSGPSGRRGFNDRISLVHVESPFRHSDFFNESRMQTQFKEVWQPFLTSPSQNLMSLVQGEKKPNQWSEAWWPFRATLLRYLILLTTAAIGAVLLAVLSLGTNTAIGIVRSWFAQW